MGTNVKIGWFDNSAPRIDVSAMRPSCLIAAAVCLCTATSWAQRGHPHSPDRSWSHLGGSPNRLCRVELPCAPAPTPAWIRSTDISGNHITFIGQAGLAVLAGNGVEDGLVFATGSVVPTGQSARQYYLFAFARSNGAVRWQSRVDAPAYDSFSAPALDEPNRLVLHASGDKVYAFRMDTGEPAWVCQLHRQIVNASPLVTTDRGGRDRVFITDFGGFDGNAEVYCIDADPYHEHQNPHRPGEIIWSYPIGGSSGNSVSYLPGEMGGEDMIYVASLGPDPMWEPGLIFALPICDSAPEARWIYQCGQSPDPRDRPQGYFGGVCVAPPDPYDPPGSPPFLYAATYSFCTWCSADSALLVKINARTGAEIWSVPSNRSQSIPVPLPGGRVALSTGLQDVQFANPRVQIFEDFGASAQLQWDTNSSPFVMGGWTQQPVAAQFGGLNVLTIGAPAPDFTQGSPELFVVNLASDPTRPDFIVRRYPGAGGSAAIVGTSVYSVGTSGLVALGPTPSNLDVNGDGILGIRDLYAWERGTGSRDVNNDGDVDAADRAELITSLRAPESATMSGGRE